MDFEEMNELIDPIDPIDAELRRALAVEPSPGFQARVRQRVGEQAPGFNWRPWVVSCGALAMLIILAVAVSNPRHTAEAPAPRAHAEEATRTRGVTRAIDASSAAIVTPAPAVGMAAGGMTPIAIAPRHGRPTPSSTFTAVGRLPRASQAEPEVIISARETAAMAAFFAAVWSGEVEPVTLAPPPLARSQGADSPEGFAPIQIEPLSIEPLEATGQD